MKKLCAAFKDLYSSYLEDMVEEDTKKWMEDHLSQCEECRKWTENYKCNDNENKGIYYEVKNTEIYEEDKKVVKRARTILGVGMGAIILLAIWTSIWIFM